MWFNPMMNCEESRVTLFLLNVLSDTDNPLDSVLSTEWIIGNTVEGQWRNIMVIVTAKDRVSAGWASYPNAVRSSFYTSSASRAYSNGPTLNARDW